MENIIKKSIEGGFEYMDVSDEAVVCDPLFWKALGKSCGWSEYAVCRNHGEVQCFKTKCFEGYAHEWLYHALRFHEINLTENWDSAVKYLENLIKE